MIGKQVRETGRKRERERLKFKVTTLQGLLTLSLRNEWKKRVERKLIWVLKSQCPPPLLQNKSKYLLSASENKRISGRPHIKFHCTLPLSLGYPLQMGLAIAWSTDMMNNLSLLPSLKQLHETTEKCQVLSEKNKPLFFPHCSSIPVLCLTCIHPSSSTTPLMKFWVDSIFSCFSQVLIFLCQHCGDDSALH